MIGSNIKGAEVSGVTYGLFKNEDAQRIWIHWIGRIWLQNLIPLENGTSYVTSILLLKNLYKDDIQVNLRTHICHDRGDAP